MKLRLCAAAVAATLALPQIAAACSQISQHVWLCDRGSEWEQAEWEQFGDGATLLLGDLVLNFTEEFYGHTIGENDSTLEEQYATYEAASLDEGRPPLEVLQVDTLTLPDATVIRHLQRDQFEDEPETMSAVMLAQVGAERIMLWLDAPKGTPLEEIDTKSRALAEMLRAECADPISCAEDYEPPSAAKQ